MKIFSCFSKLFKLFLLFLSFFYKLLDAKDSFNPRTLRVCIALNTSTAVACFPHSILNGWTASHFKQTKTVHFTGSIWMRRKNLVKSEESCWKKRKKLWKTRKIVKNEEIFEKRGKLWNFWENKKNHGKRGKFWKTKKKYKKL